MLPAEEPRLDVALVRERFSTLTARLRAAAETAGRDPDRFRVVAVTKGFGLETVQLAVQAGLTRLGENRVQEALPKIAAEPGVEWHLIGHLQSNKARRAVDAFAWIHAVHELALLRRLESIAHDAGAAPRLLLQVNLTNEPTKSGWPRDAFAREAAAAGELATTLRGLGHARVVGLMTIARIGASVAEARETFRALSGLRDRLEQAAGVALPELSMGMSADAEAAVAEGATIVRVGTALFGPRPA
jgi:PLP dependent protein